MRNLAGSGKFSRLLDRVFSVTLKQESRIQTFLFSPNNMFPRLSNYLRSYRRRSGLSQSEVAFLLGSHDGAQVSRYEKSRRMPPLRTALAYPAIFGASLGELFSGIQLGVDKEIKARVNRLHAKLEKRCHERRRTSADSRKLRWLEERWPKLRDHSDPTT
jgi:transcriptional regulator with XRE-family HTH domain